MMYFIIRAHFRCGRGSQQRQLQAVSIHADAVFAVIEYSCAMSGVAKGAVTVVADLKTILVIGFGTMRRPFHITELHFIDTVFRIYIHRESGLP